MGEPKLVLVEYVDPILIKTKGTVSVNGKLIHGDYYHIDKAILGERKGKWRIVRELPPPQVYDTKVMVGQNPLNMENLFGEMPQQEYQTKNVKKKRVSWVQDQLMIGGAEISGAEVIRVGIDCGFDIRVITQRTEPEKISALLQASDIVIINNIWAFSPAQMTAILQQIYSERLPYVKYEHDHRELDRTEFSRPLFQRSALNVFLSPMHKENHARRLGCDGICLPLAINTSPFKRPDKTVRRNNTALVCNVRHFKSWTKLQQYIEEHPEIEFTVLGKGTVVRGANVKSLPMVPYDEMPSLYKRFEYLVHLLDGLGAGERVVFEAALCGCKIVANEGVGHMSWGRDLTDTRGLREWLDQAPYEFWQEVEKVCPQ